jgi:hypothetical protein
MRQCAGASDAPDRDGPPVYRILTAIDQAASGASPVVAFGSGRQDTARLAARTDAAWFTSRKRRVSRSKTHIGVGLWSKSWRNDASCARRLSSSACRSLISRD